MSTQDEKPYYKPLPGLVIKKEHEETIAFRREVLEHQVLVDNIGTYSKTFEELLGEAAAYVGILLDGQYDPLDLMKMLTLKLKEKRTGMSNPAIKDHTFIPIDQMEMKRQSDGRVDIISTDRAELYSAGESMGTLSLSEKGKGPYTVCDGCSTSFECCTARDCRLGKPSVQLERTMETLKKVMQ